MHMISVHMVPKAFSGSGPEADFGKTIKEENTGKNIPACKFRFSGNTLPSVHGRLRISLFMKQFMIAGIRFYQKYLSPLKTTKCPYIPSCSAYGLEAIQKYGAWKGGWMALWRIMRCNPFSHGGYDPVP